MRLEKRTIKIVCDFMIIIFIVITLLVCVNYSNNSWQNKFVISDIQTELLDENKSAHMTGKIKNITNKEYSDVYVVVKYYTKVNPKSNVRHYIDRYNVGHLTIGEEKEWKSSISEEQRKNLVMYDKKIEKVEYKIK